MKNNYFKTYFKTISYSIKLLKLPYIIFLLFSFVNVIKNISITLLVYYVSENIILTKEMDLTTIIILLCILIGSYLFEYITNLVYNHLTKILEIKTYEKVSSSLVSLTYEEIVNNDLLNIVKSNFQNAFEALECITFNLNFYIELFLNLIFYIIIISKTGILYSSLLILSLLILIIFSSLIKIKEYKLNYSKNEDLRRLDYLINFPLSLTNHIENKINKIQELVLKDNEIALNNIKKNTKKSFFKFKSFSLFSYILFGIIFSINALILYFSYKNSNITVSNLLTSLTYFILLVFSLMNTFEKISYDQEVIFYARDFFNLINQKRNPLEKKSLNIESISFSNISYKYKNKKTNAINDVNFTLNKENKYFLIGKNGAGKTTILEILAGILSNYEGEIKINKKIYGKKETKSILLNNSSICFQKFNSFEMSLKLILGIDEKNQDFAKILLDKLGLKEKIDSLEKGIDTEIGSLFTNTSFSKGEWQKLNIIKTFLKNSSIYIFDEPTSYLDPVNEITFFELINTYLKNKIVIISTHRIESINKYDKVFLLDKGKIISTSSFIDLVNKNKEINKNYNKVLSLYKKNS